MEREHASKLWCRYADDGLIHCKTQIEAETLLKELEQRFAECGLELHPKKTKIVCCNVKDIKYHNKTFDFLGFSFRPRLVKNQKDNTLFTGFTPGVSKEAVKKMKGKTKSYKWHLRSELSLEEISKEFNPILIGWINYYGKYTPSALIPVVRHFNCILVKWVRRKYKQYKRHKTRAQQYVNSRAKECPKLFAHWHLNNGIAVV